MTRLYKTFICPPPYEHTERKSWCHRRTSINKVKLFVCLYQTHTHTHTCTHTQTHTHTHTAVAQWRSLPLAAQPSVSSWMDPRDTARLTDWRQRVCVCVCVCVRQHSWEAQDSCPVDDLKRTLLSASLQIRYLVFHELVSAQKSNIIFDGDIKCFLRAAAEGETSHTAVILWMNTQPAS